MECPFVTIPNAIKSRLNNLQITEENYKHFAKCVFYRIIIVILTATFYLLRIHGILMQLAAATAAKGT